jgi:putative transposase
MVKDINELDVYPWTGHAGMVGNQHYPWQDRGTILSYCGTVEGQAEERYRRFVREGVARGRRTDLTGGGLVRSQGGWAEVVWMNGQQRAFRRNRPGRDGGKEE